MFIELLYGILVVCSTVGDQDIPVDTVDLNAAEGKKFLVQGHASNTNKLCLFLNYYYSILYT